MFLRAAGLKFLDDVVVEVTFIDGNVVVYDMAIMFQKYPQLEELRKDRKLFESGYLDRLGDMIIWNDDLDFSCASIYECGKVVGKVETSLNYQIGSLLVKTRDKLGLTQKQLSRMSHIDQGDISDIETGKGNPTIGKLTKIFSSMGKKIELVVK